jgi:hypothetical protein
MTWKIADMSWGRVKEAMVTGKPLTVQWILPLILISWRVLGPLALWTDTNTYERCGRWQRVPGRGETTVCYILMFLSNDGKMYRESGEDPIHPYRTVWSGVGAKENDVCWRMPDAWWSLIASDIGTFVTLERGCI